MPGLKQLESFRNELSLLGKEREVVASWGEVYDELPLPSVTAAAPSDLDIDNLLSSLGGDASSAVDTPPRAPPMDDLDTLLASLDSPPPPADTPSAPDFGTSDFGTPDFGIPDFGNPGSAPTAVPAAARSGDAAGTADTPSDPFALPDFDTPSGGPDLSGLLESLPLEGSAPETSASGVSDLGLPSISDELNADSFAVPDDLLSGFASDIEDARSAEANGTGSAPSEDFSLEELPSDGGGADFPSFGDLPSFDAGTGPESSPSPGSAGDFDDLGAMDFTPSFEEGPSTPAPFDTFSLPDTASIPDIPPTGDLFSAEPPSPNSSIAEKFGEDFADFSIPDDLAVTEESAPVPGAETSGIDGFDGFSLDEDFLKTSIDTDGSDVDDFHIPGFSDFTSGPERASLAEFPVEPALGKKREKKAVPLELSEEDFRNFLDELSSCPLNLRIAVEEFISGDAGTELQKMEIVHGILNRQPLQKIARSLEGYLGRMIPIPRDYEKKTMAEYEQEKASLRYVFINKILPAAILFTIVAILSACTVFLAWHFIYQPLAAESLYKRGYAAIGDARYTQAMALFDEAVAIRDKKPWYFRYARAFRDKKQYISAETMYERILNRFDNDKAGGLEYAEMLRSDLRNFEKAETVLKRRLLDNYVNDPDALLLLGDTYLDWAEEDFSKYEEARMSYARLIELYGTQDPYLARMMRYFIRTDNLGEVLPLKEHFMLKKSKIGSQDLVELSGYLLGKRYEPAPGDNETLRGKIEDVRALLERAVKADPASPEAHYNMGRYFIYNYKYEAASAALEEALVQYENARTMSPKRVLTHIDSMRLLGELRSDDKEYLKAQDLYSRGITLYEEQRRNRSVTQSPLVGKLYADYADIAYFISGDLDSALLNYGKAVKERDDTPSIHYRLGYIHYQKQDYEAAMREFLTSHEAMPDDRNLLYGYGNTLFRRGDFFAAQGYYDRLMDMLEAERARKDIVFPQIRSEYGEFVELYMHTATNLAVTLDRIAERTGDSPKRARALTLLAESTRAWDSLTRNPETMIRAQGSNLAYLNIQNITHPRSAFVPEIFQDIPRTLENEKILQQRADE